jgi:hypothetical protein
MIEYEDDEQEDEDRDELAEPSAKAFGEDRLAASFPCVVTVTTPEIMLFDAIILLADFYLVLSNFKQIDNLSQ